MCATRKRAPLLRHHEGTFLSFFYFSCFVDFSFALKCTMRKRGERQRAPLTRHCEGTFLPRRGAIPKWQGVVGGTPTLLLGFMFVIFVRFEVFPFLWPQVLKLFKTLTWQYFLAYDWTHSNLTSSFAVALFMALWWVELVTNLFYLLRRAWGVVSLSQPLSFTSCKWSLPLSPGPVMASHISPPALQNGFGRELIWKGHEPALQNGLGVSFAERDINLGALICHWWKKIQTCIRHWIMEPQKSTDLMMVKEKGWEMSHLMRLMRWETKLGV